MSLHGWVSTHSFDWLTSPFGRLHQKAVGTPVGVAVRRGVSINRCKTSAACSSVAADTRKVASLTPTSTWIVVRAPAAIRTTPLSSVAARSISTSCGNASDAVTVYGSEPVRRKGSLPSKRPR